MILSLFVVLKIIIAAFLLSFSRTWGHSGMTSVDNDNDNEEDNVLEEAEMESDEDDDITCI